MDVEESRLGASGFCCRKTDTRFLYMGIVFIQVVQYARSAAAIPIPKRQRYASNNAMPMSYASCSLSKSSQFIIFCQSIFLLGQRSGLGILSASCRAPTAPYSTQSGLCPVDAKTDQCQKEEEDNDDDEDDEVALHDSDVTIGSRDSLWC